MASGIQSRFGRAERRAADAHSGFALRAVWNHNLPCEDLAMVEQCNHEEVIDNYVCECGEPAVACEDCDACLCDCHGEIE